MIIKQTPYHVWQAFFKLLLLCFISWDCLLYCFFKGRDSVFSYISPLPETSHWYLKFQVLSSVDHKNSWNSAPMVFKANCYGDLFSLCELPSVQIYFSLSIPAASLQWTLPQVCLVPYHISAFPTYLMWLTSSLYLAEKFILSVFGLFSGLFALMWMLSSWISGRKWV